MSTTSEVSSHTDFLSMEQPSSVNTQHIVQSVTSLIGAFRPLPTSNLYYSSPLMTPSGPHSYKSTRNVSESYQKLLESCFRTEFNDYTSPAPSLSTRLDFLWIGYAEELFYLLKLRFGFNWRLVLQAELSAGGQKVPVTFPLGYDKLANESGQGENYELTHTEKAKVRFRCERCKTAWTSMQGRADFKFLTLPEDPQQGVVFFRLYNQECRKCQDEVNVLWFDDEVVRVLTNIYFHLVRTYHNTNIRNVLSPIENFHANCGRTGQPRHGHLKQLCEACKSGGCKSRGHQSPASFRSSSRQTASPPHFINNNNNNEFNFINPHITNGHKLVSP